MRPHVRGSSTTGVKKSVVATSARSASSRHTAASSPVSVPTSRSGWAAGVTVARISARRPGPILQPQPAPWLNVVSRWGSVAGSAVASATAGSYGRCHTLAVSRTGSDPRRLVPRTDAVLADPRIAAAIARLGRPLVKQAVAAAQQRVREGSLAPEAVADAALAALPQAPTTLRPVLNATGVVLHTNLGRAPLSAAAREAVAVAAGTCDVELDLATGARGRRGAGVVDALLAAVPGAGGAH